MFTQHINPSHLFATATASMLSVALLAPHANAEVVSVSFDSTTAGATPDFDATELAGAPGVRVNNWNAWQKETGLTGLVDSAGNASTVEATVTTSARSQRGSVGTNDQQMFRGVIDVSSTATVSVTGIAYAEYDVYVYMRDDANDRAGSFTIGDTTYYVRGLTGGEGGGDPDSTGDGYVLSTDTTVDLSSPGTASVDSSIDQGNYVVFSGLTADSFTLVAGAVDTTDVANRNKFAGFQIVEVPEPSSLALLGIGSLLIARRRRG